MSARAWQARRNKPPVRWAILDEWGPHPSLLTPSRAELARERRLESLRRARRRKAPRVRYSRNAAIMRKWQEAFRSMGAAALAAAETFRKVESAWRGLSLPLLPGPLQQSFDRDYHYPRDIAPTDSW